MEQLLNKSIALHYPSDLKPFARCPGNVLIVAPHPDDDVIGAGGAMALLAQAGKKVFSLYVTDGRGFPGAASQGTTKKIIALRQKEALAALKIVQAKGGVFLRGSSTKLIYNSRAAEQAVREVLEFFLPESIYIPAPFDDHPTHRAVLHIMVRALRSMKDYFPALWGYTVWGGICSTSGFAIIDISAVAALKRKAIRMHRSQITYKAYDDGILARNRYEAVFSETHKPALHSYVECFLDMQQLIANKRLSLGTFINKILRKLYQQPAMR
jgi:LmbE family N-acetylglucosaminyl deacetylase